MLWWKTCSSFAILLCLLIARTDSENVLVISVFGTKSHMLHLRPIVIELLNRNHQVTYFTAAKLSFPPNNNLTLHVLSNMLEFAEDNFELASYENNWLNQYPSIWLRYGYMVVKGCREVYKEELLRNLYYKPNATFDAVIIDGIWNDCFVPLAHHLKAPIILVTGNKPDSGILNGLSIPNPYAFGTNVFVRLTPQMTFADRIKNTLAHFSYCAIYDWLFYPEIEAAASTLLPSVPSMKSIMNNVSLTMGTADTIIVDAIPKTDYFVDVGGLHCRDAKPLPQEISDIIEADQGRGFIIFSMGSLASSVLLSEEIIKNFVEAFRQVGLTVFWCHPSQLVPDLPKNIKIFPWLPQQDLLGHPKALLFFTHGGMHGMHEAIYHGVPVIGIGIFADQRRNIFQAANKGFGLALDENNLSFSAVYESLQTILTDPSYRETMKEMSRRLKDQPETPLDRAVKAVEYVMRHRGAVHLHPQEKSLNVFQYFSVDILSIILSAVFIYFYISYKIIIYVIHCSVK